MFENSMGLIVTTVFLFVFFLHCVIKEIILFVLFVSGKNGIMDNGRCGDGAMARGDDRQGHSGPLLQH